MLPFASAMMMAGVGAPPPPTDDPFFKNVALLLGANGTNGSTAIVDESLNARTVTVYGDAQISTAQSKFGGSSLRLDGTGDYLTVPDHNDWILGLQYFTLEGFVRYDSSGPNATLLSNWSGSVGFDLGRSSTFNGGRAQIQNTAPAGGSFTPTAGQFYHFCLERGSKWRMYVDGVMVGSSTGGAYDTVFIGDNANALHIGARPGPSIMDACYIDELRLTAGVARYNSDGGFVVPSGAFPRVQQTETGAYRYYKLKFTGANNANGDILFREISIATASGGSDISRGGPVSGSGGGYSSAEGPDKAINDNTSDWWQPRISGGGSVEIMWDFRTKRTLHEAILDPHPSYLDRTPAGVEVLGSNDGSTWTSVQSWSGFTTWTGARTLTW